jgi:hypothetical protein
VKLRVFIELDYRPELMYGDEPDGVRWFCDDVLGGGVHLISDEIGDEIGPVRILARDEIARRPTPIPKTMRRLRHARPKP